MSVIKPARRWQPAFYPFKRETFGRRLLARTELLIKGPVFGCRMCGNCVLQSTAFICPMECPKGMRNGPCGGVTPEKKCYVDETRLCVWNCIYERAQKTGRTEKLMEVLPPLDWSQTGTETWGDVIREVRKVGSGTFIRSLFPGDTGKKSAVWESVFRTIRQPEWWNGDSDYHPPGYTEPVTELERRLKAGEFVVATEVAPPLGSGTEKLVRDIQMVKPFVTAINFTDASSATPKMSSIACCGIAAAQEAEPVLQIASRDTTRNGIQSMALGASALGIRNILCITGDNPKTGPSPVSSMNFVDLDSVQMLWILRRMRDEGRYLDGRSIKIPPRFFVGAATTPFASAPELQAVRDHKKVNAGAQFFQTNIIFEPERLDIWFEQLDKRNILDKVYILIGVAPLRSYKTARYLHNCVPGINVPGKILSRMEKAGDSAPEEGIAIALEIIDSLKNRKVVNGIHLMTLGWESSVGRIVKDAGLIEKVNEERKVSI